MPRYGNYQTNFSAGILDGLMTGRTDTKAYDNGASQLTNWWPLAQGGVRRRPGTLFRLDLGEQYNLVDFEFNDEQRYIICFGEQKLKIVPVGNYGSAIDITSGVPWTLADFPGIRWLQFGDIVIVTHKDHPIKIITRTGATSFTIGNFTFEQDQSGWPKHKPFYNFQKSGVTLLPSGITGSITLTTSDDYFNSDHVGSLLRYKGKQIEITAYTSATQVTGTVRETLDQAVQLSVAGASGFVLGETIYGVSSGAKGTLAVISGLTLTVDMQTGSFSPVENVTGLTSNTEVSCTNKLNVSPVASHDWDEELYSDRRGYPGAVTLHQQRLFFGGSDEAPLNFVASQSAAIYNFNTGTGLDNESVQYAISSANGGQIKSFVSGQHLQIFTDQAEYYCPESDEAPLTPGSISVRRVTNYGCSDAIPVGFDNTTLLPQKGGKVIREMNWNEIEQSYAADSITLPSTSYIKHPKDTSVLYSFEDQPEQISFFLNDDGTIAAFHSAKAENIRGWHYWTTNGEFLSLRTVGEQAFTVAKRTINSVTKYYLEEFTFDALMDCAEYVNNLDTLDNDAALTAVNNEILKITVGSAPSDQVLYDLITDTVSGYQRGDIDNDGDIDINDSIAVLRFIAELEDYSWITDNILAPMLADLPTYGSYFSATPAMVTVFTGLTHLADETVDVTLSYDNNGTWDDNAYYLGQFAIDSSGQVDISDPNNYEGLRICAGLKYDSPLTPMPIEKIFQDGAKIGEVKTIVSATLMLDDSAIIEVDGYDLITRSVTDDLSGPPPKLTGLKEFYLLGWDKRAEVTLTCDVPMPCKVLSLYLKVEY